MNEACVVSIQMKDYIAPQRHHTLTRLLSHTSALRWVQRRLVPRLTLLLIAIFLSVTIAWTAPTKTTQIHQNTSTASRFQEGQRLFRQGRFTEAAERLERAVRETPDFDQAWFLLGLSYKALGQASLAETALLRVTALNARHHQAWIMLAEIATSQGLYTKARDYVRRILAFDPRSFLAYYAFGVVDYREGKLADALSNFDRSRALWSDYAPTWFNLAVCAYNQHSIQHALSHIRRAVKLAPKKPLYLFAEGWYAMMANDVGTGMLSFRRLFDEDKSESPLSDTARAFIAMRGGNVTESRKYVDEALKRDPEMVQALVIKALLLVKSNQREEAIATLREALDLDPLDHDARDALTHLGVTPPPPRPARLPGQNASGRPTPEPSPIPAPASTPSPSPTPPVP